MLMENGPDHVAGPAPAPVVVVVGSKLHHIVVKDTKAAQKAWRKEGDQRCTSSRKRREGEGEGERRVEVCLDVGVKPRPTMRARLRDEREQS